MRQEPALTTDGPLRFASRAAFRLFVLFAVASNPLVGAVTGQGVVVAEGMNALGGQAPAPPSAPKNLLQLDKLRKGITLDRQFHTIPPPSMEGIRAGDIRVIRSLGFDCVKLIVNPILFISGSRLNASNMWYVDEIVNTVVGEGMPVVVCLHPESSFKNTYLGSASGLQDLLGFYEAFAGYLAERWGPEELAFQLMTEPFGNYTSWNVLQPQMWKAVRRGMPDHTLVLSGDGVGTIVALVKVMPVDDDNVVYGFSTYEPLLVNLQGAFWRGEWWPYLGDVPYPSSPELVEAAMDDILDSVPSQWHDLLRAELTSYGNERWSKEKQSDRFQAVVDWCAKYGVRAWCSEFGNLDPVMGGRHGGGINPEERHAYLRDLREVFEESDIGWTYWSFNETFTVLDPETRSPLGYPDSGNIDARMLNALGLPDVIEGELESARLTQLEIGGMPETGATAGSMNVAFASRGGTAFASSALATSEVSWLNDGTATEFGATFITGGPAWTDDEFVGVAFAQSYEINRMAVHSQPGWNRPMPGFELQYTTVANPDETTPDGSWTRICPLFIFPDPHESETRHVWGFETVEAAGIRLVLPDSGPACYAELEVYAAPGEHEGEEEGPCLTVVEEDVRRER